MYNIYISPPVHHMKLHPKNIVTFFFSIQKLPKQKDYAKGDGNFASGRGVREPRIFFFSKAADGGGPTGRLVVEFPYRTKGALKEMEPILGASNKQQMF